MGVFGEGFQVADAVVAGAGFENVAESESAQRSVAAGAAAANCQATAIHFAALGEVARAVGAVIDINDAPIAVEPFAIGAAIARAATVIYIEDGDPSAGPILNRVLE